MKRIILKYGALSATLLLILTLVSLLIFGTDPQNYDKGEVFGYSSIVVAMAFIFFGIRELKIKYENHHLSFLKALKTGILIALFPALIFGFYNYVYAEFIDPQFIDTYYDHQLSKIKADMTPQEFQKEKQILDEQKEVFSNPIIQFMVMFFTVLVIGIFISFFSSLVLANLKQKTS